MVPGRLVAQRRSLFPKNIFNKVLYQFEKYRLLLNLILEAPPLERADQRSCVRNWRLFWQFSSPLRVVHDIW